MMKFDIPKDDEYHLEILEKIRLFESKILSIKNN